MTISLFPETQTVSRARTPLPMPQHLPLAILALAVVVLAGLLLVTIRQPIGPMYWDHFIYLDAAERITNGQIPSVDFFAPVGPLGYYLFWLTSFLFPHGQPLLIASWSMMIVTAPLMALVTIDVSRRSPGLALAFVLPFLLFSALPFTTGDFYPFPGSDGFGIYNRQVCQLLYVLAAALVAVRSTRVLGVVMGVAMLALFETKVTGAVGGAVLCLQALLAGRLPLRIALVAGALVIAALGLIEIPTGMTAAYLRDIMALVSMNEGALLPRLVQAASLNFGLVLATALAGLVLLATRIEGLTETVAEPGLIRWLFDRPTVWLAAFILAGLLFESQNTGSQAFIFIWPLVAVILAAIAVERLSIPTVGAGILLLAVALPPAVTITEKAARAWAGALLNAPLETAHLGTLDAVSARPDFQRQAAIMRDRYIADRATYQRIAEDNVLPSYLLYSDFDFQVLLMKELDATAGAIVAFEKANGVHFETIFTLDFTNPMPWILKRDAPRLVAIGADPYRAVPQPSAAVIQSVKATDLVLLPTCPITNARLRLLDLYRDGLTDHRRITLTPCADAFIRNGMMPAATTSGD